jgi:hypothetical protein
MPVRQWSGRRVTLVVVLGVAATLVAADVRATGDLLYYGGPVVSNARVVQVSWGASVDGALSAELPAFYAALTGGAYFDWLNEYSTVGRTGAADGFAGTGQVIGRGSFVGSYAITPANTATSLTDDDVAAELAGQIAAGHLPAVEVDAHGYVNSVYMIDFPNGFTITGPGGNGQSCTTFCAYHSTATIDGRAVPYAVLPFTGTGSACQGACGTAASDVDNANAVHSRQLVQAVTDPAIGTFIRSGAHQIGRPVAWRDPALGEIAVICNAQQATIGGYTVHKQWSNLSQACIVSVPDLPPCGASPARCRPCYPADVGQPEGCTGATPLCNTDPLTASFGHCVSSTPTTTTHSGNGTSTTSTAQPGVTTTTLAFEVCGNCVDDDGNRRTDFEDPACCTRTTTMIPRRVTIVPGHGTVRLTLVAGLPPAALDASRAHGDLVLQLATPGVGDRLCARAPAASLKTARAAITFRDPRGTVASAQGVQRLLVHARKDGSGTIQATGARVALAAPAAGPMQITLGLRDPATPGSASCATATVTLRPKKKGLLVYP